MAQRCLLSAADQPATGPVTQLLTSLRSGKSGAWDELLPLVYDELRVLASSRLRFERQQHTLNTTALVHEAYVKLVDQRLAGVDSKGHFFAIAAQAMRRILVSYARARKSEKRGGGAPVLSLDQTLSLDHDLDAQLGGYFLEQGDALLALDEVMNRLEEFNERGCRVVEYRFFGGLTYDEIADVMGLSSATVRRAWTLSKSWLQRELRARGIEG